MSFVVPKPEVVSARVFDTKERFPVRRIFCVGRNYADHIAEMGGDPKSEQPIFFCKPADALVTEDRPVRYPLATERLDHEVELVVALKSGGVNILKTEADTCVFGYAVGIDLTRRDLQGEAKRSGRPWDLAKSFDESAPVGMIMPSERVKLNLKTSISLSVNGLNKQLGTLGEMIWSVNEIIQVLSNFYRLQAGDLIFMGTPSGVGPLLPEDVVEASVQGLPPLTLRILDRGLVN